MYRIFECPMKSYTYKGIILIFYYSYVNACAHASMCDVCIHVRRGTHTHVIHEKSVSEKKSENIGILEYSPRNPLIYKGFEYSAH